jgi:hypothetical protein
LRILTKAQHGLDRAGASNSGIDIGKMIGMKKYGKNYGKLGKSMKKTNYNVGKTPENDWKTMENSST